MPKKKTSFVVLFAVLAILSRHAMSADADPKGHKPLRDGLKLQWDSLATLSFSCDDYPADDSGKPIRDRGRNHFEFVSASDGRRSLLAKVITPDGVDVLLNFRQDGRRRYSIFPPAGKPEEVERLVIENQRDDPTNSVDAMASPLLFLMPGGKPLYRHIDEGAEVIEEASGDSLGPSVRIKREKGDLVCELDRVHDLLPSLIRSGDEATWKVTRFGRGSGRWFPVEVILNQREAPGPPGADEL